MEEVLLGTQSRCTSAKRLALKFISSLVDRRWLVTRRSVFFLLDLYRKKYSCDLKTIGIGLMISLENIWHLSDY